MDFRKQIVEFLQKHAVIYQFMRFACIGFLNTGLNFLVVNTVSKFLNISQGIPLGFVAAVGFICAVLQSYPWNRTWTFGGETGVGFWQNIFRLFLVGSLGVLALLFVFVVSGFSVSAWIYLIALFVYLLIEALLWRHFGFHISNWDHIGHSFLIFFTVTFIGLLINSTLSSVISTYLHITLTDLDKNIAVALATGVSMFWNFVGYKVVVFRK